MRRLREQRDSADPIVAEAARLLAARPPLADDTMRRQRVRARLRRRRTAPRGAMWLRAAAMVLLVCSVAAASAMIGRVAQTIRARIEQKRAAKLKEHAQGHRHHATPTTAPVAATEPLAPPAPVAATAPLAVTAPVASPAPIAPVAAPPPAPAAAAPPPHRAPAAVARVVDAESDEQRLVAAAVRALRHEHDPARAAQLLQRYLERYPDGAAAEDALALALEATLDRDRARAAGFATRYLARYPAGRWSSLAHRALEP